MEERMHPQPIFAERIIALHERLTSSKEQCILIQNDMDRLEREKQTNKIEFEKTEADLIILKQEILHKENELALLKNRETVETDNLEEKRICYETKKRDLREASTNYSQKYSKYVKISHEIHHITNKYTTNTGNQTPKHQW